MYLITPEPSEATDVVTVDVVLDAGNARTVVLVRTPQTGETIERIMPSARTLRGAFSSRLFAARRQPANAWQTLSADEHILSRDGIETFVGQLAVQSDAPASGGRGSDRRYTDGTTLDLLLAGLCSALPKAQAITANIATMVPISLHERIADQVASALEGRHVITYNGRNVTIKVSRVDVRREAEAAYAALDTRREGRTAIIDGGGRTINIALFSNGQYVKGTTIDNVGVEAALDDVDGDLVGRSLRPLSLLERIELLDALKAGQPYYIIVAGQRVRVDTIARARFDATARLAIAEMYAKVNLDAAEHIDCIGGAAYPAFFGAVWQQELPNCVLATNPELKNAYGALVDLGGSAKRGKRR